MAEMPTGFVLGSSAVVRFESAGCVVELDGTWSQRMVDAAYRETQRRVLMQMQEDRRKAHIVKEAEKQVEAETNPVVKKLLKGEGNG